MIVVLDSCLRWNSGKHEFEIKILGKGGKGNEIY